MNQREFFRVNLSIKAFLKKIIFDPNSQSYLFEDGWNIFETKDLSANGMLIEKRENISNILIDDQFLVKFNILQEDDDFIYFIAKVSRVLNDSIALNYILINETDRDKLVSLFLKIENEKTSKNFDSE